MRIIAVANQKGGCGKTTTAINLSASLASRGKGILLIDCDPQSHATMGLGLDPEHQASMYGVMTPRENERLELADIVVSIKENLDLAPSSITLSATEQEFAGLEGREKKLSEAIKALRRAYDYIIIDCPPSIGHLCFNALRASQEVIIPIDMSLFSLRGVAKLMDLIMVLKDRCNHTVRPRALVTMFDYRTRYARQVLEKVRDQFGNSVFDSVIRYNIRLRETVDYGLPVGDFDKRAIGYEDYERLADEIMAAGYMEATDDKAGQADAMEIQRQAEEYIDTISEVAPVEEYSSGVEDDSSCSSTNNDMTMGTA